MTKNISNKKCLNAFKTIFETLLRGEEREYYEIIVKSVLTCMFLAKCANLTMANGTLGLGVSTLSRLIKAFVCQSVHPPLLVSSKVWPTTMFADLFIVYCQLIG